MIHNKLCLNCGKEVKDTYCGYCGQSLATHRFSLKHVFSHDLIHGLFHFDKGFFYTAKELIIRPGYSIREYIEGKRVKHYNYIAFLLLLTAFYIFFLTSASDNFIHTMHMKNADMFNNIMHRYGKVSYLFAIPFSALITMLCFPRAQQNFAEHLVMNTYRTGGTLMISVVLSAFAQFVQNDKQGSVLLILITVTPILYSIGFYNQYFKRDYPGKLERSLRTYASLTLVPVVMIGTVFGFLYIFYRHETEHIMQSFIEMQQQNTKH